jgi:predicted metalloprotease
VQQARQRLSQAQGNQLSVRLELQADCFAGVWAHHSQRGKGWLEQGDVEEALNAAARIGDDVLQKAARGVVVPESFTHGSAEQRQRWFRAGLQGGRIESCDTFAAGAP